MPPSSPPTFARSGSLAPECAALLEVMRASAPGAGSRPDQLLAMLRTPVVPRRPADPAAETDLVVGSGRVPVRVYDTGVAGTRPVLVYAHGGGWVGGTVDGYGWTCRRLAHRAGCVVVSVDYRLAPEHPYPAALDDCWDVVGWVSDHAAELGGDPARIAVGGSSAGGNLAAAVAARCATGEGPRLAAQALFCPVLDAAMDTASYAEMGARYGLTGTQMAWFWDQYVPGGVDRGGPMLSPLRGVPSHGLPPTIVHTAEFDPLRDEGEAYARAVAERGVAVVGRCWVGQIHGFNTFVDQLPEATVALDAFGDDLARFLGPA